MNFIQVNLNKSEVAHTELLRRFENSTETIALIQEPYRHKGRLARAPKGYARIPSNHVENARACIFSAHTLNLIEFSTLCKPDCAVGSMKVNGKQTIFASIYLDCTNKDVITQELKKVVSTAEARSFGLVISIDTNSHSVLYGNETCQRGEILEDFLMEIFLNIANIGTTPTFYTIRGQVEAKSCIDVTMYRDINFNIQNWRVDCDWNGSDHRSILFEVSHCDDTVTPIRPWHRADWKTFSSILEGEEYYEPVSVNQRKCEKMVDKLYFKINAALDLACPMKNIKFKKPEIGWYSDQLLLLSEELRKVYKKHCKKRSENSRLAYLEKLAEYKKEIRHCKAEDWKQYKLDIPDEKRMSKLMKFLEKKSTGNIGTLKKPDGSSSDPGEDTLKVLLSTHFPKAEPLRKTWYEPGRVITTEAVRNSTKEWINIERVRRSFSGFKDKKSRSGQIKSDNFQTLTKQNYKSPGLYI